MLQPGEGDVRCFIAMVQKGHDRFTDILSIDGGGVIGSQHHQPSDSSLSGMSVLVGSTINLSHLVGASVFAQELKDIAWLP